MNQTLNQRAITYVIDKYGVDLTSWLEPGPASDRTEVAYAAIMTTKDLINCTANITRDLEFLSRTALDSIKVPSMFSAGSLRSTADALVREQTRLGCLTGSLDLIMLPFTRKDS